MENGSQPSWALNGILESHTEISNNLFVLDSESSNGLGKFSSIYTLIRLPQANNSVKDRQVFSLGN